MKDESPVSSHKHYVPIVKCKNGDLWSLRNLKPASKPRMTPLIEMVPPSAKKTEQQRLGAAPK